MRPSIFIWSLLSLAGRSYASSDCGAISNNITWRLESMEYDPGLSVGTDDVVHIVMQLWMDDENLDGEDCDYFGAVKDSWYRCRNSKTPSGGPDDDISDWHVKINPTTWEVIIKHDWTCTSDDQTRVNVTGIASTTLPVITYHNQGSGGVDHPYYVFEGSQLLHPVITEA